MSSFKIYGDRVTAEVTGKDGAVLETGHSYLETAQRVAFLLGRGVQEVDDREKEPASPLH